MKLVNLKRLNSYLITIEGYFPIERDINALYRQTGLSVDEVAELLHLSVDRTMKIVYDYRAGKASRLRAIRVLNDYINSKFMEEYR